MTPLRRNTNALRILRSSSSGSPNGTVRKKNKRIGLLIFLLLLTYFIFALYTLRCISKETNIKATDKVASSDESSRTHKIPNILIFTHTVDLLHQDDLSDELGALQRNIRASIQQHPNAQVRFLTDTDCVASIQRVSNSTELADYFQRETVGMFKGDLCRGAALYETGGLYFDVDLGVRQNIFDVLQPDTHFATIRVHLESMHRGDFFQAFVGATPRHRVLKRYLELFLAYARGEIHVKGPLGVVLLRRAYEDIMGKLPKQTERDFLYRKGGVELWQEIPFLPEFQKTILKHVPPPVWGGTKRACKFVVLASTSVRPLIVPFYSRIAGSRMCPAELIDTRYSAPNATISE